MEVIVSNRVRLGRLRLCAMADTGGISWSDARAVAGSDPCRSPYPHAKSGEGGIRDCRDQERVPADVQRYNRGTRSSKDCGRANQSCRSSRSAETKKCNASLRITNIPGCLTAQLAFGIRSEEQGEPRNADREPPDSCYWPAMPLFTRTLISTRRFSALPAAVSFDVAGPYSPIAPGATICRTGTLPCWTK